MLTYAFNVYTLKYLMKVDILFILTKISYGIYLLCPTCLSRNAVTIGTSVGELMTL
jgi:hypothetical protein